MNTNGPIELVEDHTVPITNRVADDAAGSGPTCLNWDCGSSLFFKVKNNLRK